MDRSLGSRARRRARHLARRSLLVMPGFVTRRVTRERHLRHVGINMTHLTDPALLGTAPNDDVRWIERSKERPPVPPGVGLVPLSVDECVDVTRWIEQFPWDRDDQLDGRMDNHGDEVGRARAALRTRLRLFGDGGAATGSPGSRVAFDARSLQSAAFGTRGIGRFAKAALVSVREAVGDEHITLIVDRSLHPLPAELAGACEQVTRVSADQVGRFGVLISPSPMTHSPDAVVALLVSNAKRIAVVFDFIPLHYPTLYMPHVAARTEYAANLDALRLYDEFICISHLVREELIMLLGKEPGFSAVAWPRDVSKGLEGASARSQKRHGSIVLMTGDDPRKNTFGGLAGIAAATSSQAQRDVVVVGMAGQGTRVHHWSIAAAMRPGEAKTLGRVSDQELAELLSGAACVVVPSFDEGLSLPIIEALSHGAPVAASDIASHRELIGTGDLSFDPRDPRSVCEAVERVLRRRQVAAEQLQRLEAHEHNTLEDVIKDRLQGLMLGREELAEPPNRQRAERLSIGVATPWSPQRTGVADYSAAVFEALAERADVTVYATADADVHERTASGAVISSRSVEEILEAPEVVAARHDALISVVGNSHYHLPYTELLRSVDATVIAHDTRMTEFYMALRGEGGAAHVMTMTSDPDAPIGIDPALDDQVGDMRLLQNAGFWEIAQRSDQLILHSPSATPRIERETGRAVRLLPFANYRSPDIDAVTDEHRRGAREALGLDEYPEGTIHLASFGYVDIRTKLNDLVLEAAAWLAQWGHLVALHFVGSASEREAEILQLRAARADLAGFQITGYQSEERFRQWLLGIDLGIQLRISPLLGVSGPLSDLAAYGTPAIASRGLCVDVEPPEFIRPLPDAVSPAMVAEAVEEALKTPFPVQEREFLRRAYLDAKSPQNYAAALLGLLEESR